MVSSVQAAALQFFRRLRLALLPNRPKIERMTDKPDTPEAPPAENRPDPAAAKAAEKVAEKVEEIGGPKGPDPTRFGDWSVNGRCIDF